MITDAVPVTLKSCLPISEAATQQVPAHAHFTGSLSPSAFSLGSHSRQGYLYLLIRIQKAAVPLEL